MHIIGLATDLRGHIQYYLIITRYLEYITAKLHVKLNKVKLFYIGETLHVGLCAFVIFQHNMIRLRQK